MTKQTLEMYAGLLMGQYVKMDRLYDICKKMKTTERFVYRIQCGKVSNVLASMDGATDLSMSMLEDFIAGCDSLVTENNNILLNITHGGA